MFKAIAEDLPWLKWRTLFERLWKSYDRWFLREGERARPYYLSSVRAHMPELLPTYEESVELSGRGDLPARFLSLRFVGRRDVGPDFSELLVPRYILEFCTTTGEAAEGLKRVPVHMTYNRRGVGPYWQLPDRLSSAGPSDSGAAARRYEAPILYPI